MLPSERWLSASDLTFDFCFLRVSVPPWWMFASLDGIMHEMGIANSILEAIATEARRRPGSRPVKVGVRIGELAGVDPEALEFAFDALTLDTEMQGLELDIEFRAPRARCRDCGREYEIHNYELICPGCGSANGECISGDELEFAYLEVEEDEPCAAGRKSTE